MTKIFSAPQPDKDGNPIVFSVKQSGKRVLYKKLSDIYTKENNSKLPLFFCFDSENLFFKNHDFPFNNKKSIEKIIDFELEPYFPLKNDFLEFEFSILKNKSKKNSSKAFCLGLSNSYMEDKKAFLSEKNIEVSGFVPFPYFCANAFLSLGMVNSDSILIVPQNDNSGVLFAVSEKEILSAKKISNFSSSIKIASDLSLLSNFTSLSVKENFDPLKIIFLNDFETDEKTKSELSLKFSDKIVFFNKKDLKNHLDFSADNEVGLLALLCGYEILKENPLIFRKTKPGFNKFFGEYKKEIFISGAFLILGLCFFGSSLYFKFNELEKEYSAAFINLETAVNQNFPGIKTITPSVVDQAKIEIIKARESQKESGHVSEIKKIVLLRAIMDQIPPDLVELENLTVLPFSISISGTASGYDLIDSLKNNISSNKLIKNVEIAMANTDNLGKVRFRLEIKVNE
ncbi:MAG: hypothetical protein RBR53_08490 [Desulforegulaceae bacterium]|nr:hypothetical protein [Desulforegulaceae bacterium]